MNAHLTCELKTLLELIIAAQKEALRIRDQGSVTASYIASLCYCALENCEVDIAATIALE